MTVLPTRRALLLGSTSTAAAALLAACAGQTQSQLQSDIQAVDTAAQGFLAAAEAIPNVTLPADVVTDIQKELVIIQSDAATLASALTPSTGVVTEIEQAANSVALLVQPFFSEAPEVVPVVDAFVTLVQLVVNEVGANTTAAGQRTLPQPGYRPTVRFTRTQARAIFGIK